MNCTLNSSLPYMPFGNTKGEGACPLKNQALSLGVVAPPDKLPNASLYDTVYSNQSQFSAPQAQKGIEKDGSEKIVAEYTKSKSSAGKISANCALFGLLLSALSLLPFIRKH